jgi:hypothetical protein
MKVDWHTIAAVIIAIIAVGGIMISLLRGFFMTPSKCEEMQDKCQGGICKKIDELKLDAKIDRKNANTRYAEIQGALGRIEGKLNA